MKIIYTLFFVVILCGTAYSAPVISSFNQETGVLSGSGLGAHADYNSESDILAAKNATFTDNLTEGGEFSVAIPSQWSLESGRVGGNSAYRTYTTNEEGAIYYTIGSNATGYFRVTFWFKYLTTSSGGKPWRIYYGPDSSRDNIYMTAGKSGSNTSGSMTTYGEAYSSGGAAWTDVTASVADNEWHRIDLIVDQPNGDFYLYYDNTEKIALTDNEYFGGGVYSPEGHTIDLGHMQGPDYLTNADGYYFDDYTVDYTKASVELCNNSVYASSTHRELQTLKEWATGEITVEFNQGSFSEGNTAYLFVIDSDGTASAGYEITIGGTTSTNFQANNVTFTGNIKIP